MDGHSEIAWPRQPCRWWALSVLAALVTFSLACETPDKKTKTKDSAEEAARPAAKVDTDRLVMLAETLRDREFESRPAFEAVSKKEFAETLAPPDAVRRDREIILKAYFGIGAADWPDPPHPFRSLARWDAGADTVRYDVSASDSDALERAIIFALVEALDAEHFPELAQPKSWDEALALDAVRQSDAAFIVALTEGRDLAKKHESVPAFTAETLADRPDVAMRLEGIGPHLMLPPSAKGERGELLARRTHAFALREGLGLAAALYRAGGWSAVELMREEPPRATAHVVRPDRWLSGDGLGEWTWPGDVSKERSKAGWKEEHRGRIGPALTVLWMTQHLDPRIARTLYVAWESDAFRYYVREVDGEQQWALEWLTLWKTPHVAQQVVEALDGGLRTQPGGAHYTVLRKGATIAVVGSSEEPEADAMQTGKPLVETMPVFQQDDAKLVKFAPTPFDELQAKAEEAALDETSWNDPATALTASTKPLADWKLQKTDEVHLRWFAKHDDGSIVEFTTELVDPFAPAFDTKAYEEKVAEAFRTTLDDVKEVKVTREEHDIGELVVVTAEGGVSGTPKKLRVWQFQTGDYLVTFSLQAAPRLVAEHLEEARAVLGSMKGGVEEEEDAAPEGSGIREFKVE